jgi:aspartyl protease
MTRETRLRPTFTLWLLLGLCAVARAAETTPIAEIDYRLDGKLILVEVAVNGGAPVWFCFDSGAPHSIFDSAYAAQLGLKEISASTVTGTGQGTVPVRKTAAVRLQLGAASWHVAEPWIIDLSQVPIAKDTKGLIGFDLLSAYVVRIDPTRKRFAVFAPEQFQPSQTGARLPLIVDNDKLYVDATLVVRPGYRVQRRLRIDTGSESSVNDESVKESPTQRKTTLGNGLGANFESISGVFDAVHLGPFTFRNVWGPGGAGSLVGMELLRRFVVTIDVRNRWLYLEPTNAIDEIVPPPN